MLTTHRAICVLIMILVPPLLFIMLVSSMGASLIHWRAISLITGLVFAFFYSAVMFVLLRNKDNFQLHLFIFSCSMLVVLLVPIARMLS